MESGIPVLTAKGRNALNSSSDITPLCRNILVQIDGKKSLSDIKTMFRGLKGLDAAMEKIFEGGFAAVAQDCKDLIAAAARQILGEKSQTLIKKIDELHARYGDQCWEHLNDIDKVARLFYGEIVADRLKLEIGKILRETKK